MITRIDDATQDTPISEVARLRAAIMTWFSISNAPWTGSAIEDALNIALDLIYEGELEANQGRDEDRRVGHSDRHGN